MKRGSVIGPLILIGIGALFLLRNLWPEIPMADIFSRYWPFVLIAWGGLRLVEILPWGIMNKPIPRNGISGGVGELGLLIFLIGGTQYTRRHFSFLIPPAPAGAGNGVVHGGDCGSEIH